MKNSNPHAANRESNIKCVEVLVSRTSIAKNLQWTLSVYSLENNPVSYTPAVHNCDVYHFMNFDWKRTIRELLEEHKIAYKIVQYFSPETIHAGIERRPDSHGWTASSSVPQHDPDLVFHHESN